MTQAIASIDHARELARRRLPRMIFDFIDGGADDEVTERRNRRAFTELTLRPRRMLDVSAREQSTTVLGTPIASPLLLGPTGLTGLISRHGERAVARAAARHDTVYTLSTQASTTIEEVAQSTQGPLWFQLYLWRDEALVDALISRARRAGYRALVVAVDVPVIGKRERDVRNGFTVPPRFGLRTAVDILRHPRWFRDGFAARRATFANLSGMGGRGAVSAAQFTNDELVNPGADVADLMRVRSLWEGPLLVKGIMTAVDAERAVDAGADGVIVSNHGGRQLDTEPATLEVLEEIVSAVGDRAEILIDGGIRRGSDVVKCVALGARACLIGRPYLYGLAAGGEDGVSQILGVLKQEIDTAMALVGCPTLRDADRDLLGRIPDLDAGTIVHDRG